MSNGQETGRVRRRRRPNRWERPPEPHDWRWFVHQFGRLLILAGLLLFGLVAYQLWGTSIEYHRQQSELRDEFEALLAEAPATTLDDPVVTTAPPVETTGPASTVAATTIPAPTTTMAPISIDDGHALGLITIPKIDKDDVAMVQGVSVGDLKGGPGHYPDTPWPGALGNAAIAGHRSTYGAPFADLDQLEVGDEIIVATMWGRFTYRVTASEVVTPDRTDVIATNDPSVATLTLTTCHPRLSARERLIVYAELDVAASPEPLPYVPPSAPTEATLASESPTPETAAPTTTEPALATTTPTASATTDESVVATSVATTVAEPDTDEPPAVADESEDAFSHGWFSDTAAWPHVIAWGLGLIAIWMAAYLVARRFRRTWVGIAVGVVPFVVVLYFWYENVNRLLPAAL